MECWCIATWVRSKTTRKYEPETNQRNNLGSNSFVKVSQGPCERLNFLHSCHSEELLVCDCDCVNQIRSNDETKNDIKMTRKIYYRYLFLFLNLNFYFFYLFIFFLFSFFFSFFFRFTDVEHIKPDCLGDPGTALPRRSPT